MAAEAAFPVVVLSGSPDDLVSLGALLEDVGSTATAAFVVVQHLPPAMEGQMVALLARRTTLTIRRIRNGTRLEPGCIHFNPSATAVSFREDRFVVAASETSTPPPNRPVDGFLEALAAEVEERAVAVLLSGSDGDGGRGMQAVADAGGRILVQDAQGAGFVETALPSSTADRGDRSDATPRTLEEHLSPGEGPMPSSDGRLPAAKVDPQRAPTAGEAARRARKDLLVDLGHALRTPLTAVLAFLDLLDRDARATDRERHLAGIRRNADALLDILDDMRDLVDLEAEQGALQRQDLDLAPLLEEVRTTAAPQARAEGLKLRFQVQSAVPARLRSDPDLLRKLLTILVRDALRSTGHGTVTVRLDYDRNRAELVVAASRDDTSPDPADRPRIDRNDLGFDLVQRMTDRLQGSLTSADSGDATTVRVPVGVPHPDVPSLDSVTRFLDQTDGAPQRKGTPRIGTVLVVDDEPEVRQATLLLLEHLGIEAREADSGQRAIELIRRAKSPFAAILMDLQMPALDGFGTLAAVRAVGYDGPVLAFSANSQRGERTRALAAGFTSVVTKPIRPPELEQALIRSAAPERELTVVCVDDSSDVLAAMAELVEGCGHHVRTAATGAAAVREFEELTPDLCFVDLILPDTDGADLVRNLRRRLGSPCPTRFVAVSGVPPRETGQPRQLFDQFLLKPLTAEQLEDVLAETAQR